MACVICFQEIHTIPCCIQCTARTHAKCWRQYLLSKGDKKTELYKKDDALISVFTQLNMVNCPQCRTYTPSEICMRKTRQSTVLDRKYLFLIYLQANNVYFSNVNDNLRLIYNKVKENKSLQHEEDMKELFDTLKLNLRFLHNKHKWIYAKQYYFDIFNTNM